MDWAIGAGRWIDREEPFPDPHQPEVKEHSTRFGSEGGPGLELRQDALRFVSRLAHGKADILVDDAHVGIMNGRFVPSY